MRPAIALPEYTGSSSSPSRRAREVEGLAAVAGRRAVAVTDLVVIDAARARRGRQRRQVGGRHRFARHDVVEVGPGAHVDPEDGVVVAPPRDQSGVRAAGAVGGGDEGRVRELLAELERGADVAELPDRGRAAEGHGVGPPSGARSRSASASMAASRS